MWTGRTMRTESPGANSRVLAVAAATWQGRLRRVRLCLFGFAPLDVAQELFDLSDRGLLDAVLKKAAQEKS